jgi:hypothetical protein
MPMTKIISEAIRLKMPYDLIVLVNAASSGKKKDDVAPSQSSSDLSQRLLALVNQTAMNL